MTLEEVGALCQSLEMMFDLVRLVDVSMTTQYSVTPFGDLQRAPYACYAVWNRSKRCENCVSARAFAQKRKMTKFEFIDKDAYFVVAQYVEVEGDPYVLEAVTMVSDETLLGAYGKNSFIHTINEYNKKLYTDPLTGAYNRQYFTEQLSGLPKINAVAMVDVDLFKQINDTYGHAVGDVVLTEVVSRIQDLIRESDAVIRYGGDEFLLTFHGIKAQVLPERLESIRRAVENLRLEEYPELRVTLSIGAVFRGERAADYLEEADKALYQAKTERNKVEITVL